jgi:hypothetical protein
MKTILNYFLFLGIILIPEFGHAQLLSVSGYVKNFVSDNAIENATVYENKSGIGTITNNEGFYKLLLKPGNQHLTISNPGFESFTWKFVLSSDTIITISMKPDNFRKLELADGNQVSAEINSSGEKSLQGK